MEVSFSYLENFLSSPFGLFLYPKPAGGEDVLGSKPVIRYQTVNPHAEFVIGVTFHQREEAGGGGNTWVAATSGRLATFRGGLTAERSFLTRSL